MFCFLTGVTGDSLIDFLQFWGGSLGCLELDS